MLLRETGFDEIEALSTALTTKTAQAEQVIQAVLARDFTPKKEA
jgi:hypothetical protein